MAIDVVTRSRASELAVISLHLNPAILELGSAEALSEVLRRTASYHCPTTQRHMVDVAFDATKDLVDDTSLKDRLRELLDETTNLGDLLELPASDQPGRLLYLGQPSFVARGGSRFLLLGVRPEGGPLIHDELAVEIEPEGHARYLDLAGHPEPLRWLQEQGLRELRRDHWVRSPRPLAAEAFVRLYDVRLDAVRPGTMELPGSTLLDTAATATYYKGRWRAPSAADSGRFVGRRPQAYGSDAWMYAELEAGSFTRVIDLPLDHDLARGCDEAWRLQAALDCLAGRPERVRVEVDPSDRGLVSVYSPLPSWAQRRLDMVGTPVSPRRGALMCYSVAGEELESEIDALKALLWLEDS